MDLGSNSPPPPSATSLEFDSLLLPPGGVMGSADVCLLGLLLPCVGMVRVSKNVRTAEQSSGDAVLRHSCRYLVFEKR
jgi:hypothetical protein